MTAGLAESSVSMLISDAHCDTITKIMDKGEYLYRNSAHVDVERMKKQHQHIRFFAVWSDSAYGNEYVIKRAIQSIDLLKRECRKYSDDITLCCNYDDIENSLKSYKIAALLSIEGGEALLGEAAAVDMYWSLGVRSLCLTWNYRNKLADGVDDSASGGGLTTFGRKVIGRMNETGMIVDLSHISEKGFWDALELSSKPVMVSHSNAYAVCAHKRNINDSQIIALRDSNGFLGLDFYPRHLTVNTEASIDDIIRNFEHIAGIAGTGFLGLGTDFDGIESCPEGIKGIQDIDKVFDSMGRRNYSDETIAGFAGNNFKYFLEQNL